MIRDLPVLTSLTLGTNAFNAVTSVYLSVLPSLTSLRFGSNAFMQATTFSLTGLTALSASTSTVYLPPLDVFASLTTIVISEEQDSAIATTVRNKVLIANPQKEIEVTESVERPDQNVLITDCSQLASVAGDIRRLVFDDEACNLPSDTLLDLTRFVYLRNITVGMNALQHVTSVNAAGLRNLQLFEVGAGSLMNAANFTITDASKLLWDVEVSSYSVLMSMPTLVTSIIITANTGNQAGITALDLTRFVQVERIEIMENSFSFVQTVIATPMPSLTELFIHRGSLKNANMNNMIAGTIAVTWVYEAVNEEDFNQAPAEITHLIVPDNTCNDPSFTILDILTYEHLVSFVVGTNALMNVVTVMEESDKGHLIDEVLVGEYSLMNVSKT